MDHFSGSRPYHWPGFPEGEAYDETRLLNLLRTKAYEIAGHNAPSLAPPAAPKMLPAETVGSLRWQGAVGANAYRIERSMSADGPWQTVAASVSDMVTPGFPLYSDETVTVGESYFYRVSAINEAGVSEPSNVVGPVVAAHLTRVDTARNFGVVSRWDNVEIKSGDFRKYKEATYRLSGAEGSQLTYSAPGKILAVRVYAYEETEAPALRLEGAPDGSMVWAPIESDVKTFPWSEYGAQYPTPRRYSAALPAAGDAQYVRLSFEGASDIVRVEIDYVE